jgi:lipoprotein-anchoring transpeptidase ErfK/SrfK
MRSRSFLIVATLLVVLLGGVGGVYAYDQGGRDTIPEGVRIAGIDVGGLSRAQARARLERDFVARLREPIRVDHGSFHIELGPRESRIHANLDPALDAALAEARSGNMFSRTVRRLTGGEVHADLRPEVTFSKAATVRLVDHVRAAVERDAQDAKVSFSAGGIDVRPGRTGLAVRAHELHQAIDRAIVDPDADHRLVAHTRKVHPEVDTSDIDREYATSLIVDRGSFTLKLYKDFKLVKSYPIAIGMVGLETPAGLYHIQNKAVDPAWTKPYSDWVPADERGEVVPGGSPQNPLKARWLGIFNGAGIHGIDPSEYGSIGHAASHGCVRMRIPDVIDLYDRVPVGAPTYIA